MKRYNNPEEFRTDVGKCLRSLKFVECSDIHYIREIKVDGKEYQVAVYLALKAVSIYLNNERFVGLEFREDNWLEVFKEMNKVFFVEVKKRKGRK